ncbi:unnamed protein product [Chilo suppressalis]|uniref:Protein rolling stone-like n=1 Tax=Chilo suppressalis TaxID=168631 RepID=A0ABN8B8E5_CHISP|nr:unnamed protein product [Chilo suppressalis]
MVIVNCLLKCWRKCLLEHNSPSDFYVSCWQSSHLSWPLLLLRSILFLYSMTVLAVSVALDPYICYRFIYFTHWGFLAIVLETGFSTAISAYAHFKRPIDATFGLPWYVKTYWVLYNVTIPVAFLITVFYWGILKTSGKIQKYAPNPVLDVMLHGGNSVAMLMELVLSAHPSRLLHILQPLLFALAYLLFTVAYYFAGGLDPWGNAFIYPVIDWSKPQQTVIVVALTALFLTLMHLVVVAIASTRDAICRRFRNTPGIYNDGFGDES